MVADAGVDHRDPDPPAGIGEIERLLRQLGSLLGSHRGRPDGRVVADELDVGVVRQALQSVGGKPHGAGREIAELPAGLAAQGLDALTFLDPRVVVIGDDDVHELAAAGCRLCLQRRAELAVAGARAPCGQGQKQETEQDEPESPFHPDRGRRGPGPLSGLRPST